ncbi:MAG: hypothetical protein ORN54_01095, partial [Cyclobacteriaceae bacterium]|nr:hypothetical protein [Cyclobacteriaceae bacterium]
MSIFKHLNKPNSCDLTRLLSSVIAVVFYLLALASRIGTQELPSILPLLVALVVLNLPIELYTRVNVPLAIMQLVVLFLFFVAGWLSILLQIQLTFLIYLLFVISIYLFVRKNNLLRSKSVWHSYKWFIICIALALIEHVWLQDYLNPMAPESYFVGQDFVHIDTLFHVSIASMLKTYQVATVGLFGLEPISYHLGSHFLFASFAQLCSTSILDFYNVGFPIIFVPLFCQSMLQA